MDSFYQFLETRLLENFGEESSFIRDFFQSFTSFREYDKTTLLVFADWLEDKDDRRNELIRRAESQPNLGNEVTRAFLGSRLSIPQTVQAIGGTRLDGNPERDWDLLSGVDRDIFLMFGKIKPPTWASKTNGPLSINEVSDRVFSEFFWNLMAFGWGLN